MKELRKSPKRFATALPHSLTKIRKQNARNTNVYRQFLRAHSKTPRHIWAAGDAKQQTSNPARRGSQRRKLMSAFCQSCHESGHRVCRQSATSGREQMQQMKWVVRLVDHLVGDGDQRRWYRQAEHPGGFGVHHQLELPRSAGLAPLRIHLETENPHCFCSISICFVIRIAFCA
jgi:hypothetical protein